MEYFNEDILQSHRHGGVLDQFALAWVALFASWRYAQHADLMKEEVTDEICSATERRIAYYQAFYAFAVLLCVINTYISIVLLVLMQLNSVIAPRIWRLYRF